MERAMTLLWKPLLSATVPIDPETGDFNWSVILFPVYASPKIDGFRGMIQRAVLVSRYGLPVRNVELQARFGKSEYEGLDVELTAGLPHGEGVFNATSRVVKKADAKAEHVRMNVIDYVERAGKAQDSWAQDLQQRVKHLPVWLSTQIGRDKGIYLIKQTLVRNINQLKSFEAACLTDGYEGVMLRRADQGPYPQKPGKGNRSTLNEFYLARLKRFETDEAVIVAFHSLEHNLNTERTATGARSSKKAGIVIDKTRIGSVTLRDVKTGKEFDTTVGSTRLREWKGWYMAIGKTVRYKYQLIGTKDRPRINTCSFQELMP